MRNECVTRERPRIREQYGLTADDDVIKILRAEQQLKACEGCQNLPCCRAPAKSTPIVEVVNGCLKISYTKCKVATAAEQERVKRRFKGSKIPERYFGKTLADYDVDRLNETAVKFAKSALVKRRGAFLHGERGVGKTFLASIIAQEFLNAGLTVVFAKVPALLSDIRDTFNGNSQFTEAELITAACNVDLLVLDDFGLEKPTMFVGSTLCTIIDARYDKNLPTLITSNYRLEEIAKNLDHATDGENLNGSRILDRCMELYKPIFLGGKSRRR